MKWYMEIQKSTFVKIELKDHKHSQFQGKKKKSLLIFKICRCR